MQDCCDILKFPVAMRWLHRAYLSGRSAAWLARLVRDQEVEGSNPFAPTTFNSPVLQYHSNLRSQRLDAYPFVTHLKPDWINACCPVGFVFADSEESCDSGGGPSMWPCRVAERV